MVHFEDLCPTIGQAFNSESKPNWIPDPKRAGKFLENLGLSVHIFEFYDAVHGSDTLPGKTNRIQNLRTGCERCNEVGPRRFGVRVTKALFLFGGRHCCFNHEAQIAKKPVCPLR